MKQEPNFAQADLPEGLTDAGYETIAAALIKHLIANNRARGNAKGNGRGLLGGVVTIQWEMNPNTEHGVLRATWEEKKL